MHLSSNLGRKSPPVGERSTLTCIPVPSTYRDYNKIKSWVYQGWGLLEMCNYKIAKTMYAMLNRLIVCRLQYMYVCKLIKVISRLSMQDWYSHRMKCGPQDRNSVHHLSLTQLTQECLRRRKEDSICWEINNVQLVHTYIPVYMYNFP